MGALIDPVVLFLVKRFFSRLFLKSDEGKALRFSIFGMSLGLIPMITVLVVSDGMINGIVDRFKETLTYHIQVQPWGMYDVDEFSNISESIKKLPGVNGVFTEKQGFALAYSGQRRTGVTVRGVDPRFMQSSGWLRYVQYLEGQPDFSDNRTVQLGQEVARKLGVGMGDELKIMTSRRGVGRQILPPIITVRVGAVISSGYQELDRLWVLMPFDETQTILPSVDYTPIIGISLDSGVSEERIRNDIQQIVPFGWRVRPWYEINRNQYQNYQSTRAILLVIMSMILIVSSVNIASSLLMTYLERRKEIAILKSLGASPHQIQLYFGLLGVISSVIGTFLGITFGLLTAININNVIKYLEDAITSITGFFSVEGTSFKILDPAFYLETIPVNLSWETLLLISALSLIFGLVSSWFPALKASRSKPLTIIRKI